LRAASRFMLVIVPLAIELVTRKANAALLTGKSEA
jgi:hypothetical protein